MLALKATRAAAIPVASQTPRATAAHDACYRAGANSYVQKPVDLPEFRRALDTVKAYWFDTVVLPVE